MFVGKARRVEHLKGAYLGLALALPANIRLGWKGLPETNIVAYYEKSVNYGCKKFYSTGPWRGKERYCERKTERETYRQRG